MPVCPNCHTENADEFRFCQSCGAELSPAAPPPSPAAPPLLAPPPSITESMSAPLEPPRTSGMAIASLVLGILGLFTCGVSAVFGVVFGIVGLLQAKNSQGRLQGSGLAIAGLVISAFLIVVFALLGSFVVPAMMKSFGNSGEFMHMATCTSHQQRISQDILLYAQDHHGVLPPSLQKISVDSSLLECPSALHHAPHGDYGYNSHLAGATLSQVEGPATAVMMADCARPNASITQVDDIDWTRHHIALQQCCVLAYVDGHVSMQPYEQRALMQLDVVKGHAAPH
jgi:hypothetical protein